MKELLFAIQLIDHLLGLLEAAGKVSTELRSARDKIVTAHAAGTTITDENWADIMSNLKSINDDTQAQLDKDASGGGI